MVIPAQAVVAAYTEYILDGVNACSDEGVIVIGAIDSLALDIQ
jgi:hypothetical protein